MKNNQGFTLFEIMIALFVLSIGLLGLAGLQMSGLKKNHSAHFRTEATLHAYDILDNMRINRAVAIAGGYDITLASPAPGTDFVSNWLTSLAAALPNGDGAIATNGGVTTVTVQWDDSRAINEANNIQTFTVSTIL